MNPLKRDLSAEFVAREYGFMHVESFDVVGNGWETSFDTWNELNELICIESIVVHIEVLHGVRGSTKCLTRLYTVVYNVINDVVHASPRGVGETDPTITELLLGCSYEVRCILRLLFFLT